MKGIAQRYASALADVTIEQKKTEQVQRELSSFVDLYAQSVELRNFLTSPAVSRENKQGVIRTLTGRMGASPTLRNFLLVLADHRRCHLLPAVHAAFLEEVRGRLGVAEAEITSARELGEKEKAELTRILELRTGKRIQASYSQDPTLIGGAVVRVGSTIYDGSVRARLDRLRVRLAAE